MKKKLILTIIAIFATVQPISVFASSDLDIEFDKATQEAHNQLIQDGILQQLNDKLDQYYENYGENSIYSTQFENAAFEEKAKILQEQMSEGCELYDNDNTSKSISKSSKTNNMAWDHFQNGDIVLVHGEKVDYGYFRHCGTYFSTKGKCISAQVGKGVIYEPKSWYNLNYDEAIGLHVAGSPSSSIRSRVMRFLNSQIGKPYAAATGYMDYSTWSCVKLPWVGWGKEGNINIAVNPISGKELTSADVAVPDSIYRSPNVYQFTYGD